MSGPRRPGRSLPALGFRVPLAFLRGSAGVDPLLGGAGGAATTAAAGLKLRMFKFWPNKLPLWTRSSLNCVNRCGGLNDVFSNDPDDLVRRLCLVLPCGRSLLAFTALLTLRPR